jgi:hypothetical protein
MLFPREMMVVAGKVLQRSVWRNPPE